MPEGITLKRIIDMDETQQLSSSDYVLVDSSSGGNRKYNLGEDLNNLKDDLTTVESDVTDLKDGLTDLNEELNDFTDEVYTLFDKTTETIIETALTPTTNNGWYISSLCQLTSQNNQDFKVSTVPVEKGVAYRLQGTTRLQADYPLVAFGNTDVMSIGATGVTVITGSTTNTSYDEYYTPTENGYLWIASYSTRQILSVTPYRTVTEYKNAPVRKSLKMQLFGDSLTDNTWGDLTTWVNHIQDDMPLYDLIIVNSAVGGSRLSKGPNTTNAVENIVENGTSVVSDADLYVIWAGTNDWGSGGPELGTFLGTYGIYGAVKNIIQTLSTAHPTTMILFITPLQRYNSTDQGRDTDSNGTPINTRSLTLKSFCDAIMETCVYFGIPCLDMNGGSGINRINISSFTSDGLHPNSAGDKRIAHIIGKKIDSLFGYCQ